MGKEDVYESDYLENGEIFADLVNGILYGGEQVVKPQELREEDAELRSISGEYVRKTIRDKVRLWKGTVIAIFAVENQTKVDYRMVLRAMLAESMAYDKQWKKLHAKYKKAEEKGKLTADEIFSGMMREDKFIPVITIVVYYGREKPWDGARTLYELLDVKEDEKRILPFISNYRLNIFDYHEHDSFEQFHSELQSVFEFLKYSHDKELFRQRLKKHEERYKKLSRQAKILLTKLTNIKKIPDVTEKELAEGDFDMCKAFEDMKEEGRIEGRMEGRMEGRAEEIVGIGQEFGLSETKILERLQNKLNISMEEAQNFFARFAKQLA